MQQIQETQWPMIWEIILPNKGTIKNARRSDYIKLRIFAVSIKNENGLLWFVYFLSRSLVYKTTNKCKSSSWAVLFSYFSPPHVSDRALWYSVGRPCVFPLFVRVSVHLHYISVRKIEYLCKDFIQSFAYSFAFKLFSLKNVNRQIVYYGDWRHL